MKKNKSTKKNKNLVIIAVCIVILFIGFIICFSPNKNKTDDSYFYQATKNDSNIIKYVSKNDIIKVELSDNKNTVFFNDKEVATVLIKKEDNKIIEEYYKTGINQYRYKKIAYLNDGVINYSEKYNNNDTLLSTSYYNDNKVEKIVYNDSFEVTEYKEENDRLIEYSYKKDILYSKCQYDEKNIYKVYCEYYDKKGNVIEIDSQKYDKYGFFNEINIEYLKNEESENTKYELDNGIIKYNTKKSNKENPITGIEEIYNFFYFGSTILYESPYLYNQLDLHRIETDEYKVYYDNRDYNFITANKNDDGYSTKLYISNKNSYLLTLNDGVKFKSYNDGIDYYHDINFYNVIAYTKIEFEYVKDCLVKETYNSKETIYYDWFDGSEISQEEYNIQMEELKNT